MTFPQLAVRRAVAAIESGTSVNSMDLPSVNDEAGVLKTSCVSNGYFDAKENKVVDPDERHRVSCPVRSDRLIVSRMNTPALVGAAGYTQRDYDNLYLPDRLWQVRTSEAAVAKYLYWWMQTREYRDQVAAICVGTSSSMQNLSQDDFRSFQMPFPNLATQNSIAKFLDRETAQIDKLIGRQEQLIDLLSEKRQAIITHAVTKGLDATAPTKPSGIPWLGDVPIHWDVKAMRYLCKVSTGSRDTVNAEAEGQFPFFVRSQTVERINTASFDCEAVLTAGDGAGVGKVFHYFEGQFDAHQRVYVMRDFGGILGRFFFYFFSTLFAKVALDGSAKSTVDSLRRPTLIDFMFTVPPPAEQEAIVSYVDEKVHAYKMLQDKAERCVELLRERRSAVISAAVNGKIKCQ